VTDNRTGFAVNEKLFFIPVFEMILQRRLFSQRKITSGGI
jgi:hypothetical protein